MPFPNPIIDEEGGLIVDQIQSPDYSGVFPRAGWRISKSGAGAFNGGLSVGTPGDAFSGFDVYRTLALMDECSLRNGETGLSGSFGPTTTANQDVLTRTFGAYADPDGKLAGIVDLTIVATIEGFPTAAAAAYAVGTVLVNGVAQSGQLILQNNASGIRSQSTLAYSVSVSLNAAITLKLQIRHTGTVAYTLDGSHTKMVYTFQPKAIRTF